jgi:long-chain acyl-CoA synthetase
MPSFLPIHGVGEARPDHVSLCAMLEYTVTTAGDRIGYRQRDVALTWRQAGHAVSAVTRRIEAVCPPSGVVALLIPNSIAFAVTYYGALQALAVPALLNPAYPVTQLTPMLRAVAPAALICTEATADLARSTGIEPVIVLESVLSLAAEPVVASNRPAVSPDDTAALLFTGGTTGLPKTVAYSHKSLLIAVRCVEYNWPTRMNEEVWLPISAFTHIYGFVTGVLQAVAARAEIVIPERFQPDHVVDLLNRHRVTVFGGGPPAIYAGVLSSPGLAGADLSALRLCPAGGAPFPLALVNRWRRATGLDIHEGYGMTEMPAITGTTALSGVRPGSVGRPIPCNEVQIVDLETGMRVLAAGEAGEVRFRGPHMMSGYVGQPEETARTIRDGFIYTGDIGHLDPDGFLFITDRKKDVVFVKGFNVFPRQVEEVLHTHPDVGAAGVVGVPDPRTGGERLVAWVVARDGADLTEASLKAHCAAGLAPYQCPAEIRVVDALPMTGVQKLDRVALRRIATQAPEPGPAG